MRLNWILPALFLPTGYCFESVDFGSSEDQPVVLNRFKDLGFDDYDTVSTLEFPDYSLRVKQGGKRKLKLDTADYYTGYLDVHQWRKHFFYWFFESRNDPANDPVILWLNGGPGCSLAIGLFFELGPSSINAKLETEFNPHSWNANASVLFFDQPVGVGYSYSDDPRDKIDNTYAAGRDVYVFLELFFRKFPQFADKPFHIAGESYGGHYVPEFAYEILQHPERLFNLLSIMIGNGITDPKVQWPYYQPMACGLGGQPAVLNNTQCRQMQNKTEACLALVDLCYEYPNDLVCQLPGPVCMDTFLGPYIETGLNPYDIRVPCGDSLLCYKGISYVEQFLSSKKVREELGVNIEIFKLCNDEIGANFGKTGDGSKPFQGFVSELLEAKIPVLVYVGDKDYICNWLGNEAWTKLLPWKGQADYALAKPRTWSVAGVPAGVATSFEQLTFLRVFDAGHMVPFDQPRVAQHMVNQWIQHYHI